MSTILAFHTLEHALIQLVVVVIVLMVIGFLLNLISR